MLPEMFSKYVSITLRSGAKPDTIQEILVINKNVHFSINKEKYWQFLKIIIYRIQIIGEGATMVLK